MVPNPLPDDALAPLLACPACAGSPLTPGKAGLHCAGCKLDFPLIDGLPWLFPAPAAALSEWRGRLRLLRQYLTREAALHQAELDIGGQHPLTRQRLQRLAEAYAAHERRIAELLQPLDVDTQSARMEVQLALGTELPETQGLTNYYANVHRDWAWGDEENRMALDAVARAMRPGGPARRLLVLGAGAGRLAYDLHQAPLAELTVALDFNPLLLLLGRRVARGERIELYEFPIAPRGIEDHALLRALQAPGSARPGLEFVLGDALAAPFAPASFDVVLTPWFVDIVPDRLTDLMARVNRLLVPGGRWVFLGSLAWADRPPSACYSLEELLALAPTSGLDPGPVSECSMPYMCSPASRHGRVERVICLAATKTSEAASPAARQLLPAWIQQTDLPVPALPGFREQSLSTRVYAFIMAMIDGSRSIDDMAVLMEEQKLMPQADAVPAIQRFLARMLADADRRANF